MGPESKPFFWPPPLEKECSLSLLPNLGIEFPGFFQTSPDREFTLFCINLLNGLKQIVMFDTSDPRTIQEKLQV